MKHLLPTFLLLATTLSAQSPLPTRTATIFKNGRALLQKSGPVALQSDRYTTRALPEALFGTFWASAASGALVSVFSVRDSVETMSATLTIRVNLADILRGNKEKRVLIYVDDASTNPHQAIEGWFERDLTFTDDYRQRHGPFLFRTIDGWYLVLQSTQLERLEFKESPTLHYATKVASQRLDLNFQKNAKREQDLSLLYLVDSLGWSPVYRLDLTGKTKGHLALRAEIANDAEDLGDAELRLAVGVPNFALARQKSLMVDFDNYMVRSQERYTIGAGPMSNSYLQSQSYAGNMGSREIADEPAAVEGAQAEDFYFYTVRPGNFPKHSRFQYPIFETEVVPAHFYECVIATTTPGKFLSQQERNKDDDNYPVIHFIEFKNTSPQPWTTGVVNILSQTGADLQPVSQDLLPYTPTGALCKVRIAQSPEIRVTHAEGVKDRKEDVTRYFNRSYDLITVDGQAVVVNYRSEPVKIKIRCSLEGKPLSSEQQWTLTQEQATLRVNSTYEIEWELELKAGEERKWTYSYEVLVDL